MIDEKGLIAMMKVGVDNPVIHERVLVTVT
jgi:hypothetical protein